MYLVDATGYVGNDRFQKIEDSISDWFYETEDRVMVINKSIGNGVLYHVERTMMSHFPFELEWKRFSLGVLEPSVLGIRDAALKSDIIIIDEAENLERLSQLAAELVTLEEATRFILIVQVPMDEDRLREEGEKLEFQDQVRNT